jgi:hypothetical protein
MTEGLRKFERDSGVRSIGYRKNIPQYGDGRQEGGCLISEREKEPETSTADPTSGPAGRIVVIFPDQRQRDLFGADALKVPDKEIFGWRGGLAPSGVQKALRHEMRRRGLRHIDAAHRVGVSRPHLENIMQGRFGASEVVASRIRSFLIEGAKTVGIAA